MPAPPCIICSRRIYTNSRAVTCDVCERWNHISCGNTDPAPVIVSEVNTLLDNPDLPEAARPTSQSLYMMASRARTGRRPDDPSDLNFEVDEDYLATSLGEPETDRFFDYVEETWLHSSIWRVADWSQYGRAIRTNNDLEGWHGKLNRRARKGNLPFYLMAALLFAEAQDLRLQIRLVREGKLRRHQSKRSKAVEGRIWGAWESFRRGSIRTGELLKTLSFIYAPSSL